MADPGRRKPALDPPFNGRSRLAVLSPEVVNHDHFPELGRSLWQAFACFDCELGGAENVTLAEARISGHASLPYGRPWCEPHPVFDLAYPKPGPAAGDSDFKVYPPTLDKLFDPRIPASLRGKPVIARKFRLEQRSFPSGGDSLALDELAAFRQFFLE